MFFFPSYPSSASSSKSCKPPGVNLIVNTCPLVESEKKYLRQAHSLAKFICYAEIGDSSFVSLTPISRMLRLYVNLYAIQWEARVRYFWKSRVSFFNWWYYQMTSFSWYLLLFAFSLKPVKFFGNTEENDILGAILLFSPSMNRRFHLSFNLCSCLFTWIEVDFCAPVLSLHVDICVAGRM